MESFPIVLKTRSCSLLTMLRSSSPSDAMALVSTGAFFAPYGTRNLFDGRCVSGKSSHGGDSVVRNADADAEPAE